MGAPGYIQGLTAEQEPQSLAPASLAPALDHRAMSPIACSSGCSCADWQGFATACLHSSVWLCPEWEERRRTVGKPRPPPRQMKYGGNWNKRAAGWSRRY